MANNEYLVQVEHLKEYFPVRAGFGRKARRRMVNTFHFTDERRRKIYRLTSRRFSSIVKFIRTKHKHKRADGNK